MSEVIKGIFSSNSVYSSSRLFQGVALVFGIALVIYDTYINKRLDNANLIALLSATTIGYGVGKVSDNSVAQNG